jgi:transposase
MPERRKYDSEFREGAVTIVRETGKSIAEVARDLGIGAGTLGSWVRKDRLARGEDSDRARLDPGFVRRLERENAELRMERDVLKRSVVLWVKELERHEALANRAVVKGRRRGLVAASSLKLGAA